jgi:hypothetical protein
MISAAQVIFNNQHGDRCLMWLAAELSRSGIDFSPTEWRGYATVIPQLLVPANPASLTIQVEDDPEYVPEEIAELAGVAQPVLSEQLRRQLAACDTRLEIMSTTPPNVSKTNHQVAVVAQTDLDPEMPEVQRVLLALSSITNGFVVDCVNGHLRASGGSEWVNPWGAGRRPTAST